MDVLVQHDAQATFFVLGKAAKNSPHLIRAMAQGGHYVANHTYGHPSLAEVTHETLVQEVEGTKEIILDIALDLFGLDQDVRYLRPPYGATDANTRQYAADLGYAVVLWDINPQDWRRPGAKVIADHVIRSVKSGAIILMRDGGGARAGRWLPWKRSCARSNFPWEGLGWQILAPPRKPGQKLEG
jgi:peptidoglycan/xylan/chitin deacetylase (PgdA/CDA1 family)